MSSSGSAPRHLSLNVALEDGATFENYYVADASINQQLLAGLASGQFVDQGHSVYIWGDNASGKSHLLQALCHQQLAAASGAVYLPLAVLLEHDPVSVLDQMYQLEVVCIDDIHLVLGHQAWQEALFHLYNDLAEVGHCLVVAADRPPPGLEGCLPDLVSRLGWGLVFRLESLTDEDKLAALIFRARQRGLRLGDEAGRFILSRGERDFAALMAYLDRIVDSVSRERKTTETERVTVPFIKELMGW